MKKNIITIMAATVLLTSCGTWAGEGAGTGAYFGSILGSAIGGITGGPHGSDVGTIIGMAGGAIAGAAIGQASEDRQKEKDMAQYQAEKARLAANREARKSQQSQTYSYEQGAISDSGFDANMAGDDRLYDFDGADYNGNYSAQQPTTTTPSSSYSEINGNRYDYSSDIEIRNARFVDNDKDGVIMRGEVCKIIFEVYNRGSQTLYDVQPTVMEVSGNKHIRLSQNMHVESLAPGKGIRYTAIALADNRLKDGVARFNVTVLQGGHSISQVCEFNIPTRKR